MPFLLLLAATGCSLLDRFVGDDGADAIAVADAALAGGDVAGAVAGYEAIYAEQPDNLQAAVGVSYGALLSGDLDRADAVLAQTATLLPESAGELELRRALIALEREDTDAVVEHGKASGLPAGTVLAAEVLLADGERDEAQALLEGVSAVGPVGDSASEYLALLNDPDDFVKGLAECYALWALGFHGVAVRSAEEPITAMSDDSDRKAEELLLWAGRAAGVGEIQVSRNLLEGIDFPPPGQSWRVKATTAVLDCAEGFDDDYEACRAGFAALEGIAPPNGLLHAKATAARLVEDPGVAAELLGDQPSLSSAGAAASFGNTRLAGELAPAGMYKDHLE